MRVTSVSRCMTVAANHSSAPSEVSVSVSVSVSVRVWVRVWVRVRVNVQKDAFIWECFGIQQEPF